MGSFPVYLDCRRHRSAAWSHEANVARNRRAGNDFEVCAVLTSGAHSSAVELRHLRYFVGVAEALNFRAAAEALHVSAPALSKQIRILEEELGVRLLDRDTTGARLNGRARRRRGGAAA